MSAQRPLAEVAAERVAAHFEGAAAEGALARIPSRGLEIGCEVGDPAPFGPFQAVPLYLSLRGGELGEASVFASISGYHDEPEGAVVEGACLWTCSLVELLDALETGNPPPYGAAFEATVVGSRHRVVTTRIDRCFPLADGIDPHERIAAARAALGDDRGMAGRVVDTCLLPAVTGGPAVVLSTFVSVVGDRCTAEVKVQGVDWPPLHDAITPRPQPEDALVMLRELTLLRPLP